MNYWIKQSVYRRFQRLQNYIKGQWIGLKTEFVEGKSNRHYMKVQVIEEKQSNLTITGNIPPSFQKALDEQNKLHYVMDIRLEGSGNWSVMKALHDPITGILHFHEVLLPDFHNPNFLLVLEAYIDQSVEEWKKNWEHNHKCEESSSS